MTRPDWVDIKDAGQAHHMLSPPATITIDICPSRFGFLQPTLRHHLHIHTAHTSIATFKRTRDEPRLLWRPLGAVPTRSDERVPVLHTVMDGGQAALADLYRPLEEDPRGPSTVSNGGIKEAATSGGVCC